MRGLPSRRLFFSLSDYELDVKHPGISKGFALMIVSNRACHVPVFSLSSEIQLAL